jgi:hypothetical protein
VCSCLRSPFRSREVRSPHFVIVGALSEKETVDLTRDLERFRDAVQIVTNMGRFDERIPTKVYVLPQAVPKLGFKEHVGGYFIPGMRANYAAVVPVPPGVLGAALRHEYVHFLVHNQDDRNYPRWYDEGFAEVLSTMTARGKVIEYGEPMPARVAALPNGRWMPSERLLDIRACRICREASIRCSTRSRGF